MTDEHMPIIHILKQLNSFNLKKMGLKPKEVFLFSSHLLKKLIVLRLFDSLYRFLFISEFMNKNKIIIKLVCLS